MNPLFSEAWSLVYDNDVDIFIPEFWANEGLMVLEQQLVLGNLVHRDFENSIQQYGDTVNIAIPGTFTARRKTDDERVVLQDVTASKTSIKLDQHWHTSFIIKDGEESKSYVDLVELYIRPAVISIAEAMDRVIAGQYVKFLANISGRLGGLSASTALDYILDARGAMNNRRVPSEGRNALLTSASETEVLKRENFLNAATIGDDGSALRDAVLGRKLGFNFFTSPNVAYVPSGNTLVSTTTTAAQPAGTVNLAVAATAGMSAGMFLTIAGDDTPLQIATVTDATHVALYLPTRRNTASGAAVTAYAPGAVNQPNPLTSRGITVTNGYPIGWHKQIAVNGFTGALPGLGQAISFGNNNASVYAVIESDPIFGITLDRPLEFAVANAVKVNIAPAGSYNLLFHRNAIALVTRPLATPKAQTGARSSVINYNSFAMRSTITYQGMDQGHLVTLDMLAGVAVLQPYLGQLMLG
jgi:hypothetical protein